MQFLVRSLSAALLLGVLLPAQGSPRPHLMRRRSFCLMPQTPAATPPTPVAPEAASKELPLILMLVQRKAPPVARRVDVITTFVDTLQNAITDAKQADIVVYSPDRISIRRALQEHRVAVADLIEPIKTAALERIAHAIGAHQVLVLSPTFDAQGLAIDMHLFTDDQNNDWHAALSDDFVVDTLQGRIRRKNEVTIALAVDNVTQRLGIPTHLTANFKVVPDRVLSMGAKEPAPAARKSAGTDTSATAARTAASQNSGDAGQGKTGQQSASQQSASQQSASQTRGAAGQTRGAAGQANVGASHTASSRSAAAGTVSALRQGDKMPVSGHREIATTAEDLSAASAVHGEASVVPEPEPRPDYAGIATHYQQAGDLPGAITMLHRAIDADPYNATLRRQLIQAYIDRKLYDMALAEATRSMALLPNDAGLTRFYGDTLLARGDTAGAIKAYQDLIQHAPQDVTGQVALGDALLTDGKFTEAVDAYETAARSDPKSPLPHRRLARVYAARAESDARQYEESLKEVNFARSLTPVADIASYESDYVALMLRLDARLRDMADALQTMYEAGVQGKKSTNDLQRDAADLKERANALADFLDQLPPAAGQDDAHAHYSQAAALLLQSIGTFRRYLSASGTPLSDAHDPMQVARFDTLSALTAANKRLTAAHDARTGVSNASDTSQTTDQPMH